MDSKISIKYNAIQFELHRCAIEHSGNLLLIEFKVGKGYFKNDPTIHGFSVRPYDEGQEILTLIHSYKGKDVRETINCSLNDLLHKVIQEFSERQRCCDASVQSFAVKVL